MNTQRIQDRYHQIKENILSFSLWDTIQEARMTIKQQSSLLLLNMISLTKQAIHNHEATIDKDKLSDYFYDTTHVNLIDLKVIEYRSPRKNEHPLEIDWKKEKNFPAFLRFDHPVTKCGKVYEWKQARILKEIIDLAAPHIAIEERY